MIEHALEHLGVALCGHELEDIGEIAVVVIRAGRNPRGDSRRKVGEVEPPLLAGVAAKEFLAEVLANAVQDDVLAGLDLAFWDANRFEMRRRTGLVEIEIVEAFNVGRLIGSG